MRKLKTLRILFFFLLFISWLLSACTMQKRLYRPGYYVQKKGEKAQTHPISQRQHYTSAAPKTIVPESVATNRERDSVADPPVDPAPGYVKAFATEGPVNKAVSIPKRQQSYVNEPARKVATEQIVEKKKQKSAHDAGGKSQVVALLLCIFLGWLGIHRFYLGYTGMGILYLFTLGILGIGWLIDTILLIIPNGLTPKGRTSYDQE